MDVQRLAVLKWIFSVHLAQQIIIFCYLGDKTYVAENMFEELNCGILKHNNIVTEGVLIAMLPNTKGYV